MRKILLFSFVSFLFLFSLLSVKNVWADCSNRPDRCSNTTTYPSCKQAFFSECEELGGCHWNDGGSFCAYKEGATPAPVYNCENRDPKCPSSTHDCIETQGTCNAPNTCLTSVAGTSTRYCAYPKGTSPVAPPSCTQENQVGCSGNAGTQGNCCDGLICESNGGQPVNYITNGVCKKAPSDFGPTCYKCASGSSWNGSKCVDSNGEEITPESKGYCGTNSGLKCVQGQGCIDDPTIVGDPNAPLLQPCDDPDPELGCKSIKTAFGPVSTDAAGFTKWILGFVLSISGGIVLIIIIISGYRLMTSAGDPEKVKNARDQLTAAIVGLLFIIFSLVILELITRDVLGLPGFGG